MPGLPTLKINKRNKVLINLINPHSFNCRKDYVGIYYGNVMSGSNLLVKFCERRRHGYLIYHNLVTVYLHTDQTGGSRPGILGTFTAIGMTVS